MAPRKNNEQRVQVSVRSRPLSSYEKKNGMFAVVDINSLRKEVRLRDKLSNQTRAFAFDHVFTQESEQNDVYKAIVSPMVAEVLKGYNCTVFAYGQTGTGKTYTMEGERTPNFDRECWDKDPAAGIIPRAMKHIFDSLAAMAVDFYSVKVSYVELYNEELLDLLSSSMEPLKLRIYDDTSRKGATMIQGLDEVSVHNREQVFSILEKGSLKRKTAATLLNDRSSRSHAVFTVTVVIKEAVTDGDEVLRTGKLNLVDLAGSENIGRSGAVDKRAREAGNINQSLLTLGRVITALGERASHIPYRESKLTRMLQDSLGGRTKTSLIATISPSGSCYEETMSTLDYAFRTMNVTNKPEVNTKVINKSLLKEYSEEMDRLKRDLMASREKNGIYITDLDYQEQQSRLMNQANVIKDYDERLNVISGELLELKDLYGNTVTNLEETRENLQWTKFLLEQVRMEVQEQKYLVAEHLKAEEILTTEGQQLLDTVNSSVQDVNLLHDKLDRKRSVDSENSSRREELKSSYTQIFEVIETTVNDTNSENISQLNHLKLDLEHTKDSEVKNQNEMKTKIDAVMSSLLTMEGVIKRESEQQGMAASIVSQHQSSIDNHIMVEKEWLNKNVTFMKDTVQLFMSEFELMCSLNTSRADNVNHITSIMDKFQANMGELNLKMCSIKDALDETFEKSTKQQTEMEIQTTQFDEKILNHRRALMEFMDEIDGFVNHVKVNQECMKSIDEVTSSSAEKLVCATEQCITIKEHAISGMNCAYTRINDEIQQTCNIQSGVKEMETQVIDDIENSIVTPNKILDGLSSDAAGYLSFHHQHHTSAIDVLKQTEQYLQARTSDYTEQLATSEKNLSVLIADLDAMLANLDKQRETHDQSRGRVIGVAEDVCSTMLQHVTNVKIDVPTGETPQRREFTYPRKIYERPPHDILLRNFKNSLELAEKEEEENNEGTETNGGTENDLVNVVSQNQLHVNHEMDGLSDIGSSVVSGVSSLADFETENIPRLIRPKEKIENSTTKSSKGALREKNRK